MKFVIARVLVSLTLLISLCACAGGVTDDPVVTHGALRTEGALIVDKNGKSVSLSGPSFFWSNSGWGGDKYYNAKVVDYFRNSWNAKLIRAAIGVDGDGSYIDDPDANMQRAVNLIEAAINQGLYIIVDWHSHYAEKHEEAAQIFFKKIAEDYGEYPNIIYEIYNEPLTDTDWKTVVKPYAERTIQTIRKIDPDNLIVVGTQTWSQDVDKAAKDPISGYKNIVYALHFYAGSHKAELRQKAQYAINQGLPLMVTEWGTVNADGDGAVDYESVEAWLKFMRKNKLSHCNWSVHSKEEAASMLKPKTPADGNWSDKNLTESGLLVKKIVRDWNKT